MGGVGDLTVWAADRAWQDIPLVPVVGAILGALLLVAAIKSMFGKKK